MRSALQWKTVTHAEDREALGRGQRAESGHQGRRCDCPMLLGSCNYTCRALGCLAVDRILRPAVQSGSRRGLVHSYPLSIDTITHEEASIQVASLPWQRSNQTRLCNMTRDLCLSTVSQWRATHLARIPARSILTAPNCSSNGVGHTSSCRSIRFHHPGHTSCVVAAVPTRCSTKLGQPQDQ